MQGPGMQGEGCEDWDAGMDVRTGMQRSEMWDAGIGMWDAGTRTWASSAQLLTVP